MKRLLWPAITTALVAAIVFPLYWVAIASFTPEARLFGEPALVPDRLVLAHYRALFTGRDFWTPIRNSLIVASATTALCLLLGAACAYALARLRFRGKAALLALVLAVSMFPQISIVSPLYLVLRELRLLNTYPGLLLPYLTFAMPLTIWLLVGFFRQLPPALEEAGLMDGAGRLRTLWEIILPLSWPGLATAAIVLGQVPNVLELVGSVLLVGGVAVGQLRRRASRRGGVPDADPTAAEPSSFTTGTEPVSPARG